MKQKINVYDIQAGSRCSQDIFNKKEILLLPANHTIHPLYIKEWTAESEFVITSGTFEKTPTEHMYTYEIPGYIDKESRILLHLYYNTVNHLKHLYASMNEFTIGNIQSLVLPWVNYALTKEDMSPLVKICRYSILQNPEEDYFYFHSIDTMLISLGLYKQYYSKMSSSELSKFAINAILCDIGMFLLPKNITAIDTIYTDQQKEEIKKHTTLGFSFLTTKLHFPAEYAITALEHHERPNGSGYPQGFFGELMHPHSILISLADVFASQFRDRSFKQSKEPVEILKDFINTMMPLFPKDYESYISAFVSYLTIYPVTSIVLLSTNEVAIVIQTFSNQPTRPKLMIILDAQHKKYQHYIEIDLREPLNQHINIKGIYTQELLKSLDIYN